MNWDSWLALYFVVGAVICIAYGIDQARAERSCLVERIKLAIVAPFLPVLFVLLAMIWLQERITGPATGGKPGKDI